MLRIPMLARRPGHLPAGVVSEALQCQVDLPVTFLDAAGISAPGAMQGLSQWRAWRGETAPARDWVLVENRHNPTTVHLRTLVTSRFKITVYRGHDYGELFDLEADPHELRNLWDEPRYADVKAGLLLRFVQAEMEREPTRMPRIAGA